MDLRNKIAKTASFFKNKYLITLIIFLLWILIFDQNNLIDRFKKMENLNNLKEEKAYYRDQIKRDSARLKELQTNKENLENFAREEYYMKKKDEDVFIIVEEDNDQEEN